jgi:hypothetical protein
LAAAESAPTCFWLATIGCSRAIAGAATTTNRQKQEADALAAAEKQIAKYQESSGGCRSQAHPGAPGSSGIRDRFPGGRQAGPPRTALREDPYAREGFSLLHGAASPVLAHCTAQGVPGADVFGSAVNQERPQARALYDCTSLWHESSRLDHEALRALRFWADLHPTSAGLSGGVYLRDSLGKKRRGSWKTAIGSRFRSRFNKTDLPGSYCEMRHDTSLGAKTGCFPGFIQCLAITGSQVWRNWF